jgi:hypothetical protein
MLTQEDQEREALFTKTKYPEYLRGGSDFCANFYGKREPTPQHFAGITEGQP